MRKSKHKGRQLGFSFGHLEMGGGGWEAIHKDKEHRGKGICLNREDVRSVHQSNVLICKSQKIQSQLVETIRLCTISY